MFHIVESKKLKWRRNELLPRFLLGFPNKMGPNTYFGGRNLYLIRRKQKGFLPKKRSLGGKILLKFTIQGDAVILLSTAQVQ